MASIESLDLSIDKLFSDFYIVPNYQREYVWEKEQVQELFDDIYQEFESSPNDKLADYFIGSIIVCERENNLYEVIDGQQRITTIFLFLCAIKDHCITLDPTIYQGHINLISGQLSSNDIDSKGDLVTRYRIQLQYEDSCDVLETIAKNKSLIKIKSTISSKNLKAAYDKLKELINDEFTDDDIGISKLKRFYHYFCKNVTLVRVKTTESETALKVFATINDRGVTLDQMDLVKNLIFAQTSREEHKKITEIWKDIVDRLHKHKIKPLEFIRYFILAKYNEKTGFRKSALSDWFFGKNGNSFHKYYQNKAVYFAQELLDYSKTYINFSEGKNPEGKANRHLKNITFLSSSLKMHLMVLLSGKHLSPELFLELSRQIENITFIYYIVDESKPDQEKNFTKWCQIIRNISSDRGLSDFIHQNIKTEKERLSDRFERKLNEIEYKTRGRSNTLVKYILAKLNQYISEKAYGSEEKIEEYDTKQIEIEHIFSQKPDDEIKQSFDKSDEIKKYVNRLGNLTLLEKPFNAACGNKSFAEKKDLYQNSKYLLTKTIVVKNGFGKNTSVVRAIENLETFTEWNSQSIKRRQKMLVELAKEVWDISDNSSITVANKPKTLIKI